MRKITIRRHKRKRRQGGTTVVKSHQRKLKDIPKLKPVRKAYTPRERQERAWIGQMLQEIQRKEILKLYGKITPQTIHNYLSYRPAKKMLKEFIILNPQYSFKRLNSWLLDIEKLLFTSDVPPHYNHIGKIGLAMVQEYPALTPPQISKILSRANLGRYPISDIAIKNNMRALGKKIGWDIIYPK